MAASNLSARMMILEGMFSNTSTTGMCVAIEKKIQGLIKQHLVELEARAVALTDSKVDASDFYLKLKTKVETTDFSKILNQFLAVKNHFNELIESNDKLKKRVEENEAKYSKEIKALHTIVNNSLKEYKEKFQTLSEQIKAKETATQIIKESSGEIKTACELVKQLEDKVMICERTINELSESYTNTKLTVIFTTLL